MSSRRSSQRYTTCVSAGSVDGPLAPRVLLMRIGTRRSALALAQAGLVAELLAAAGHGDCEIVPMSTGGDRASAAGRDPAADGSDKSRWVVELEDALADGRIDLAVHSAKDVPGELAEGLALHGAPARAPAEDVLCGVAGLEAAGSSEPG